MFGDILSWLGARVYIGVGLFRMLTGLKTLVHRTPFDRGSVDSIPAVQL
jgi:hypothetical protein